MNSYQLVSEILIGKDQPNIDMLITKPSIYLYVKNEYIEAAKDGQINTDSDGKLHCYFTRIPESLKKYSDFLSHNSCVKIQLNKLKRIKDQKIKIYPFCIEGYDNLTFDDVEKIASNNNFFYRYYKQGCELEKIPHIILWCESKKLPSFSYKELD